MRQEVEFTGKKVQDAVSEGLKTLGLSLDDADVKILSNGGLFKKAKVLICYDDGLSEADAAAKKAEEQKAREQKAQEELSHLGGAPENEPHWGSAPVKREPTTSPDFGKKKENVPKSERQPRAPKREYEHDPQEGEKAPKRKKKERESADPTEEQIALAKDFAENLLQRMHIEGTVEIAVQDGMCVNVQTEDARIIGHRGEVLDAVQQLISSLINSEHGKYVHVSVDGLGYRDRRKDTLQHLAERMAEKAVRTHRKVSLDAMNSADRRVVHAALGDRDDVFTKSEGHEPQRRVVIIPKKR